MRLVVINHLTLDGVMQAPAHAEEDTRDGFVHGGWAQGSDDPELLEAIGARMSVPGGGMLLGKRSYDGMLSGWNERGGPFKEGLNAARKYVASRSAETQLQWPNSTLISGDLPSEVAKLKSQEGGNLVMMGSGELIRALMPHGLIDEFLLMIHPLVLGSGHRLFDSGDPSARLELVESTTSASGILVAAYRPAG